MAEQQLPILEPNTLQPTRDFVQDVAKVLGKLQQAFVSPDPRDWDKGLLITEAGLSTQPLQIGDEQLAALLDMRKGELQIGGTEWQLEHFTAPQLLDELQHWLVGQGSQARITPPTFGDTPGQFLPDQSKQLISALAWFQTAFTHIGERSSGGFTSPVLIFPHHFDLSLVWFPLSGEQQLSLGFSTGDATIAEPYLYLTAYPEPAGLSDRPLPAPAYWQHEGFSGAILRYRALSASRQPQELLESFAGALFEPGAELFN
jgi:hypothetical protein